MTALGPGFTSELFVKVFIFLFPLIEDSLVLITPADMAVSHTVQRSTQSWVNDDKWWGKKKKAGLQSTRAAIQALGKILVLFQASK